MTKCEFERLVEKGIAAIPERFQQHLSPIVFVVDSTAKDDDLLGLFEGPVLAERNVDGAVPPTVTIFQHAHEKEAESPEELERLVAETVWHEVAHYLGMEEDEVVRAEKRKRRSS